MSPETVPPVLPAHREPPPHRPRARWVIPLIIAGGVLAVAAIGFLLRHHAETQINHVALASSPKEVSVVRAEAGQFRPTHRYVGTLRPWVEAKIGPQFISAYVSTVLVRPGAAVKRGQVLGTLDCRDASSRSRSIEMEARALQSAQVALASQAQRMTGLLDGGYIAANEVDLNSAQSQSQLAKLQAEQAKLADAQLSVSDCVLRAPFDGDVGQRSYDPGAFVRPGDAVVSLIDRSIVRLVVDVPESDFPSVAPGAEVEVHLLAVAQTLRAQIARRSPEADPSTRTIHIEIDLPDPRHQLPINTSAELTVGVGAVQPATHIPTIAADLSQDRAKLFLVEGGVARGLTLKVLGEIAGDVYFLPDSLPAGALVVEEGRAALHDQDAVKAQLLSLASADAGASPELNEPDGIALSPTAAQAEHPHD